MPGIAECDGHAGHGLKRYFVIVGNKLLHTFLGVGRGVKRFDRWLMFAGADFETNMASCSWMCAESSSMMPHKSFVADRAMDRAVIIFAECRQFARVIQVRMASRRRRQLVSGSNGKFLLSASDSWRWPWNNPHSSSSFLPFDLDEIHRTVVVRAAPKKWIFMGQRKAQAAPRRQLRL